MELLSIPTLSDLFVHQRIDLGAWHEVAEKIRWVQSALLKYKIKSNAANQLCQDIYVDKTVDRIQAFLAESSAHQHLKIKTSQGYFSLIDVIDAKYNRNDL